MTQVRLHQIYFRYREQPILENFSYTFGRDQITIIIGRSGSGKSTVLQLINGLLRPQSGRVEIDGEPLNYGSLSAVRLRTGYLIQGNGLFPHITVGENISIAARVSGTTPSAQRTDELMELTGLPVHLRDRYPSEISGGEQQRAAICRALYLDPPLLLVDEPFGLLDPITRHELRLKMLELQRIKPRTVIMVTHDIPEARLLGDHLVVIDKGTIVQSGACNQVLENPRHDIVRQIAEAG